MDNPAELVGAPFEYGGRGPDAFDCYGLVKYLHEKRGHPIPDCISPSDQGMQSATFSVHLLNWEKTERAPGTVAVIRIGRLVSHCAYLIDHDRMIHTWENSGGVVIERVDDWLHRIVGFYRYVGT